MQSPKIMKALITRINETGVAFGLTYEDGEPKEVFIPSTLGFGDFDEGEEFDLVVKPNDKFGETGVELKAIARHKAPEPKAPATNLRKPLDPEADLEADVLNALGDYSIMRAHEVALLAGIPEKGGVGPAYVARNILEKLARSGEVIRVEVKKEGAARASAVYYARTVEIVKSALEA